MTFTICVVDDDQNLLNSVRRTLKKESPDWEVHLFLVPKQAIDETYQRSFDLFLSDFYMDSMSGVDFLVKMKDLNPSVLRVLFSGMASDVALMEAINRAEGYRFISKPVYQLELISALDQACSHDQINEERRKLPEELELNNYEFLRREQELTALQK